MHTNPASGNLSDRLVASVGQAASARTAPGLYRTLLRLLSRGEPITIAELAAVATDDFKKVLNIKLGSLIWREPFSQKPPAASFLGIFGKEVPVQLTYCLRPGSANEEHALNRQRGEEKTEFLQRSDRMT